MNEAFQAKNIEPHVAQDFCLSADAAEDFFNGFVDFERRVLLHSTPGWFFGSGAFAKVLDAAVGVEEWGHGDRVRR